MPCYALFGSTGNVGQAVLKVLLQSSDNRIHAYCRSKEKLQRLTPGINDNAQVQIFEGDLQDTELLEGCLKGTRAAFFAIAPPGNQPGCTIVRDAAGELVKALESLAAKNERLPKIVLVSSASTEHRLMHSVPAVLRNGLYRAFSNVYDDLKETEKFLRSKESLVSLTVVKPGALSNDAQKGHVLSLDTANSPISYLDLAGGMLEIADEDTGRYDQKSVAVNAAAKDVAFPWEAPFNIFWGLVFHLFPWLYAYLG